MRPRKSIFPYYGFVAILVTSMGFPLMVGWIDEYRTSGRMIQCLENRTRLDQRVQHWAASIQADKSSSPTFSQLAASPAELPKCPDGGNYILGSSEILTVCSVHHVAEQRLPREARNRARSNKPMLDRLLEYVGFGARTSSCYSDGCENARRQLAGAIEQWQLEDNIAAGEPVDVEQVSTYIAGGIPSCPHGGRYVFGRVGDVPRCTVLEHSTSTLPRL